MFLAIFYFDELLLIHIPFGVTDVSCNILFWWIASNMLKCCRSSGLHVYISFLIFIFLLIFFICPHFGLICIFLSWSLFFFLLLSDPSFFLFVIMVSFYSWSSSSSDHLPTVFCLCSAPFIHFLPDLKYFSSASIEVHFPWNKVFLLLLSLFKRKGEKMSVWSLSLFTLSWLALFSLWYLILW